MTAADVKKLLEGVPDDAPFLIEGPANIWREAEVRAGLGHQHLSGFWTGPLVGENPQTVVFVS